MAKYFIEDTTLTAMADKIRALTGTTGTLTPTQMTTEVQSAKEDVDSAMSALETLGITIPEGSDIGDLAGLVGEVESGTDTSDATAVAGDIMLDKTAYGSDGKLTGTFTLDSEIGTQESLIATIKETLATKSLPDNGGGGSVETCTGSFRKYDDVPEATLYIIGTNENMEIASYQLDLAASAHTVTLAKNTLFFATPSLFNYSAGVEPLINPAAGFNVSSMYLVTDDFSSGMNT